MKHRHALSIGLLSVGLSLGWTGAAGAQDANSPGSDQAKPAAEAQPGAPAAGRPAEQGRRGQGRGQGRRQMDPARMLERVQASFGELNLSDEQKTRVKDIVDKAKPKLDAVVKETEGKEPRERMTKIRETIQPVREELMAVLDETQRQKLRELTQAREGRSNRAGGPAMFQRMKDAVAKLDLTDEQKKKLEPLLAETEKQFTAIRAEAAQAQGGAGGGEIRAKYRELMQTYRKGLNEILTEEQRAKLRELTPRRDGQGGRPGGGGGGQGGAGATDGAPREPL